MKFKFLTIVIFSIFSLAACGGETEPQPEPPAEPAATEAAPTPAGTRDDPYVGHGVIQEVQEQEGRLLIEHDEIPGFMAAMTMAFPVGEGVEIENLEAGDEIISTSGSSRTDIGFSGWRKSKPGKPRNSGAERLEPYEELA